MYVFLADKMPSNNEETKPKSNNQVTKEPSRKQRKSARTNNMQNSTRANNNNNNNNKINQRKSSPREKVVFIDQKSRRATIQVRTVDVKNNNRRSYTKDRILGTGIA